MIRIAIIAEDIVVNVTEVAGAWQAHPWSDDQIAAGGALPWSPPAGHSAVESADAAIGWIMAGNDLVPPAEPEPAPLTVDDYRRAIQAHIDATAGQRGYDSGVTCTSYVSSTNPVWAAEAAALSGWRDAIWAYAYAELEKVQGGERPQPSVAEIVGELPAMNWPA